MASPLSVLFVRLLRLPITPGAARPSSSSPLPPDEGHSSRLLHPRRRLALVEIVRGCQLDASCRLAHPDRLHWRFRLDLGAAYEHQFHVADEGTGREAPAPAHAVVRHPPLHRASEVRQRLGSESIDTLGDAALRLRQAGDVGEHGLVAFRCLRGACLARHGDQQLRGGLALGGLLALGPVVGDALHRVLPSPGAVCSRASTVASVSNRTTCYGRSVLALLCEAIAKRKRLAFTYEGHVRVVESYCHGFTR